MAVTSTRSRTALSSSSIAVFPREDPSSSPEPATISPNSSRPDVAIGDVSVSVGIVGPSGRIPSSSPKLSSSILVPDVDVLDVVAELVPARPSTLVSLSSFVSLVSLVLALPSILDES